MIGRDPFLGPEAPYVSTSVHEEAIARILYGIEHGERLILMRAGEGLGKSLVLNRALAEARQPLRRIALVRSPFDGATMLGELARALGHRERGASLRASCWRNLANAVRVCRLQGLSVVLAVDDDHELTDPIDRQDLDRLVHLDPLSEYNLSIVRVGHECDLDECVGEWGLAVTLSGLTRTESERFIRDKMAAAGRDDISFTPRALHRLYDLSRGVPRGLDRLASLALFAAEARRLEVIPPEVVDGVAAECVRLPAEV
jgi:general secretion pathway protein A